MVDLQESTNVGKAALLRGLNQEQRAMLAEIAREVPAARGDRLISQGDPANMLCIAASGEYALAIDLLAAGDVRQAQIERKVPFEAFGWSALIKPHESQHTVYCTKPGSIVAFARDDLLELFAADPVLGNILLGNVAEVVGKRRALMQRLWIEEVEQSMVRVKYWLKHTIDDMPAMPTTAGARRLAWH